MQKQKPLLAMPRGQIRYPNSSVHGSLKVCKHDASKQTPNFGRSDAGEVTCKPAERKCSLQWLVVSCRYPHQESKGLPRRFDRQEEEEEEEEEKEEENEISFISHISNHAAVAIIFAPGLRSTFCIICQLLRAGIIIRR